LAKNKAPYRPGDLPTGTTVLLSADAFNFIRAALLIDVGQSREHDIALRHVMDTHSMEPKEAENLFRMLGLGDTA